MQHPDVEVIKAEREGGIIKVDQIRELRHRLSLAPYESNYRIAILQRFEEANESASNALLKTLEEPAPQVVLMLTSESVERLLATISSRCEVIRLKPVPIDVIKESLQARLGVSDDHAGLLAHLSGGRPGYAIRLHENPEQLERRNMWLNEHYELLSSGRLTRFAYAYAISNDREKLRDLLHVLLSVWRDILHRAAGAKTPLFNPDRAIEIDQLASSLGLETACRVVAEIERTIILLERNVNSRLAVEVLLMNIPQI
jgi:DNA polymerase-3 subunit delta'